MVIDLNVLKNALTHWLKPQDIEQSLIIWQRYYRTCSVAHISSFAEDIALRFGLHDEQSHIRYELCQAFNLNPAQKSTHRGLLHATTPSSEQSTPMHTPKVIMPEYPSYVIAFSLLHTALVEHFEVYPVIFIQQINRWNKKWPGLRELVHLGRTGTLPPVSIEHILDPQHLLHAKQQHLRHFTNHIYVELCSEYGPVDVDQLWHQLFNTLERSHKQLHIRELL